MSAPMQKLVSLRGERARIVFPFDPVTAARVKELPGRKYHNDSGTKCWSVPVTDYAIECLAKWGFTITNRLREHLTRHAERPLTIPGLKRDLFPFQMNGVSFLEQRGGNALIADEQGLGKTITALAYLQLHPELRPAVIVTPAALKLNWRDEAHAWIQDSDIEVLRGQTPYPTTGSVLIINYDILPYWVGALLVDKPRVIIADEVHLCKSQSAQRTRALKLLVKSTKPHKRFIGLTGTPVVNRPIEYFNTLNLINPKLFSNRWKFAERYCGLKHTGFGWDMNGSTHADELYDILTKGGPMLRRLKSNVLPDLPDKIRSYVPIAVSKREFAEYQQARDDFKEWVKQAKGAGANTNAIALVKITALKRLAARAKLASVCDWIRNQLDGGNKLVVFAHHIEIQDKLMAEFAGISAQTISGDKEKSNAAIKRFQSDPHCQLFVGSLKRDGVGITLTAASSLAFLELPWSPGDLAQAEDRIHRIGQKNSVNIYYLLAEGTIDKAIAKILDSKRKVVDKVTDGVQTADFELLSTLMQSI